MIMATPHDDPGALPNIGKNLAQKLKLAGIENAGHLKMLGAEKAFIKIKSIDKTACINMLFAIEGAIQGIRWHDLDKSRKEQLKEFFRMTDSMSG